MLAVPKVNRYKEVIDATTFEEFVATTYRTLVSQEVGEVFQGKPYIGKRSGHNHNIDVSIETKLAGVSIIILVECKFYKNAVQLSDVLEFAERISDIGAHKGILVTTVGFQEGCFRIARGHGIALVRTQPVWQIVQYSRDNKGTVHGAYFGPVYIGGGGERLVGITVDTPNFGIAPHTEVGKAWQSIVMHLADPNGSAGFNTFVDRNTNWQIIADEPFKRFRNQERLMTLLSQINDHSGTLPVDARRHNLVGDICSECGCSAEAIVHFNWWNCR